MLVNLSKDEMSTILYVLGDYVQDNDNEYMVGQINPISRKFEGILDAVSYTHLTLPTKRIV